MRAQFHASASRAALPFVDRSPYARGEEDGLAGKPGPAFPTATSPWHEKLYNRGWEAGITRRAIAAAMQASIEVRP